MEGLDQRVGNELEKLLEMQVAADPLDDVEELPIYMPGIGRMIYATLTGQFLAVEWFRQSDDERLIGYTFTSWK